MPRVVEPLPLGELALSDSGVRYWVPFVLFVLALLVRFIGLGSDDLWFDEVQSFTDGKYPRGERDGHALFFRIMSAFSWLSSDPTTSVRIYPALAGALAIPLVYDLARRLAGSTVGLIAAVLLTLSEFHLYYSAEARFYAPMVLFSLVSWWGIVWFLQRAGLSRWLGLPVAGTAWWLLAEHHPATLPSVLGQAGTLLLLLCFSRIGLDALRSFHPALHRLKGLPWILLAVLLAVGGGAIAWKWTLVWGLLQQYLLHPHWGSTQGVDFTGDFFVQHLVTFGWDFSALPGTALSVALFNIGLTLGGLSIMIAMRPSLGLLFMGTAAATFLAIFASNRPDMAYLVKYSCTMLPVVLLSTACALAALLPLFGRGDFWQRYGPWIAAGFILATLLPGYVRQVRTEKMPTRALLEWLAENQKTPARLFAYGHYGYNLAFYQESIPATTELEYFPWHRKGDAGHLEVATMRHAAKGPSPAYFIRAWGWDIPKPVEEYLAKSAELVYSVPSLEGEKQEGRIYRLRATDGPSTDTLTGLQIADFDRFRRPNVVEGKLSLLDASMVRYAPDWNGAAGAHAVELSVRASEGRAWFLAVRVGDNPLPRVVPVQGNGLVVLKVEGSPGALLEIAHVSDFPERRQASDSLFLDAVRVRPWDATDRDASFRVDAAEHAWTESSVTRWMVQPKELIRSTDVQKDGSAVVHMGGFAGNVIFAPFPSGGARLGYARVELRPEEYYGAGGNALLISLNGQGQVLGQGLLANKSHESNIRWSPVEGPLLWENRGMVFEMVRPLPSGTEAIAAGLTFWALMERSYRHAPNRLHLRPLFLGTVSTE